MHFWYSLWLLGLIFSNACFFCFVLFFYYLYWYLISRFWRDSISRGFIFTISAAKHEKGHYFSQFRVLDFILGFKSLTLLKKKKKSYLPSYNLQRNQQGSCQRMLCTDHAHYVKIIDQRFWVQGGTVSHYYILVIRKFIDFMSLFRHSIRFSFSVKQSPSSEFGMCNIWLRIADKNRQRVELSSSGLLQTLEKLRLL